MKRILIIVLISSTALSAQILPNYGGERSGLSALTFLKNDLSITSAGIGGTSLAMPGDAYSVISNPAGLSKLENTNYALSHLFFGAGINQSYLSGIYPLKDRVSKLAFSINSLNSGEMEERTEFAPAGTGRQIFVSNTALGLTYSRKLSKMFTAGVTLKYVFEGIAEYYNHTATIDMAFLYETDVKGLQFAVMVQNFGGNSSLGGTDDNTIPVVFNRSTNISLDANTVPTTFKLGASFLPWEGDRQSLRVSAQLNHPNDNAENYALGAEYNFNNAFMFRLGYMFNVTHQNYPTFGFSYKVNVIDGSPFFVDYAANPTNYLGLQNLIGLRFNFKSNEA